MRVEKTITVCDVCGAEGGQRVAFEAGRELDRAGSVDGTQRCVDLCVVCLVGQVAQFVEGLPLVARVAFHKTITVEHKFFPRERIFTGR